MREERGGLRARISLALAVVTAVLTVLTLFWPAWIERLTGADPDGGSGSLEVLVTTALFVLTVLLGGFATYAGRPQPAINRGVE